MENELTNVEAFSASSNVNVLLPGSVEYDKARKIWNGMFDKEPAIIAQCTNSHDIVESLKYARENDLTVSVKSGGHHSAGTSTVDGGMMIDLSLMQGVKVDPENKTARVQAGCLLGTVDTITQKYGLAISAGIVSHTGISGLTLGGGMGWISRKHGLSVDNLLSAEVVTAEGKAVKASESVNPDLFWAIRGGGGNFGIVSEFEFRCAEIGNEVYAGPVVKRFDDAKDYMRFHRDFVRGLPDEMTVWLVIRHAPPLPFIPEEYHGKLVVILPFVWLGDPEEGKRIIQPLKDYKETVGDGSGMVPWTAWQSAFDGLVPHGARNYWKSHHLKELPDQCIEVIVDFAKEMPTDECEVFIPHMEGAPSKVPADATAFSHRSLPFVMNIHTRWQEPADDERCIQWARDFFEATREFSQGVYVNFITDLDESRARDAYTKGTWDRLVKVKSKWDPENVFRMNMNIKPNGGGRS